MNEVGDRGVGRGTLLLAVVLTGALFVYPLALSTPLLDPDEGLHAAIAQEMVERGDWLVPRLFGRPFLDKPAFYFWFEATSLSLFGMNEAAVRLPGLVFGFLGAVSTGLVAWRTLGRGTGKLSAALYATMFLPMALCQSAAPDVALVVWVNLALLSLWESEFAARRAQPLLITLAGALMGLAILTKGLFGVALIVVAQGGFLLVAGRLTAWAVLRGFLAVTFGAALASFWYLPMEEASPGYLTYFFIDRHFLGFVGDTQLHGREPFWYYLPILLVGGLPWLGYLPALAIDGWSQRKGDRLAKGTNDATNARRALAVPFLLAWAIGCTLLLSVAGSKLITYIWPVFPPLAILAAETWRRFFDGEMIEPAKAMMLNTLRLSCLAGPVVFPLAMLVGQVELELPVSLTAWLVTVAVGVIPLGALGVLRSGNLRATLATAIVVTVVQFVLLMTWVLPSAAERISARTLAAHFNEVGQVPERVRFVDERVGSFIFYLDPLLRRSLRFGQVSHIGHKLAPYEPVGTTLIVPEHKVARARRRVELHRLDYELVGRHRVYAPLSSPPPRAIFVEELRLKP